MSSEDHVNPIHSVLHHTQVGKCIPTERKIFNVAPTASVEEAVKLLSEHKIQSCPVIKFNKDAPKFECVGMVDMLDIASYVVSVAPTDRELEDHELKRLEMAGRAMSLVPITRVIDHSGRDPLMPLYENSPLSEVCSLFGQGIHHVVIFNQESEEVVNVYSQTDLIKFLVGHLHMGESKAVSSKTAGELGIGASGIVKVSSSSTVIEGLRLMQKEKISSLALVDPLTDRLVGNFSASDLVGLYQEHFPSFKSSLKDFLETHSEKSLSPNCARLDSTLLDIVKLLDENNLHHLWVVDDDFKPTGIISITDICRAISNYQYF